MGYDCPVCGEVHDELPHVGTDRPDQWWDVAEEEREGRIRLTTDTCEIDGEHFFIRGVIEIPVHEDPDGFGFGVWVSQKKENFYTYLDNYDSAEIGPFFGWLCTRIACYDEDTLLLKTRVHFRGEGLRPSIVVEPSGHPLSVDQQNGISLEKAWRIVHYYQQMDA